MSNAELLPRGPMLDKSLIFNAKAIGIDLMLFEDEREQIADPTIWPKKLHLGRFGLMVAHEGSLLEERDNPETGEKQTVLQGGQLLNCVAANCVEVVIGRGSGTGMIDRAKAMCAGRFVETRYEARANIFIARGLQLVPAA